MRASVGLRLSKQDCGGRGRQILAVHLAGDFVDLQNGLLDAADHNVQALTNADVAFISSQAVLDLAAQYPNIANVLWRDTLMDASLFRESIVNIGRRSARQRVAHLICELAVRLEAAGICEGPRYEWPMTQEQLGDATGLTAVHVNRTIQKLRTDKLIDTANRAITVLNWPALQAAGDFTPDYLHLHPTERGRQLA